MKVGFIGLGIMGASMASNLQKAGHALSVHDIRRQAAASHLASGAEWKDTPRAVAEAVDVVFTSLPGPPEVESVALGADGLIHGMKKGAALFDLSTNSPALIRKIHAAFTSKGVDVLDAPVSGGPIGAKTKKLAIWVGGDRALFDRHKALLDAMGDQAYYVGPIGAGAVAKLVHNCTSFAVRAVIAETFSMGVKAGVEPLALWKAMRQGATGRRRTFDGLMDKFLPGHVRPAVLRPRAGAQGRVPRHRARARGGRADAPGQPRARRDHRGAQPRLGRQGLEQLHASRSRARRHRARGAAREAARGDRAGQPAVTPVRKSLMLAPPQRRSPEGR